MYMYFVRKLKKNGVNKKILSMFYKATVESLIAYCMSCWYGNVKSSDKKKLKRIVWNAKKLGCDVTVIDNMYKAAVKNKSAKIIKNSCHPLHNCFKLLRSGQRLDIIYARTNRFRNSFAPSAIRILNVWYIVYNKSISSIAYWIFSVL